MTLKTVEHGRELLAAATPGDWRIRTSPVNDESFFVEANKIDPVHPYNIEVLGDDDTLYPTRRADAELIVWLKNNASHLLDCLENQFD